MKDSKKNKIELIKADITKLPVDAVVNAANSSLMGGGGVDGAIHRAGGGEILEECKKIVAKQGACNTGEAVITSAGKMPAKFVIHTVGPIWKGGNKNESEKLKNAYLNSMKIAVENNCKTIAFPNISTGIYGFPKNEAANIAVQTVIEFLNSDNKTEKVIFVCFDDENYNIYKNLLDKLLH